VTLSAMAGPAAPDRIPTAISARSSSRAPSTVDSSMTSDANMAWLLAIAADVCLTGHERTMTFVELGCGENHLAIERILNSVKSSRMTLPVAIFDRLTRRLDGYVGSPEEPRLRGPRSRTPVPAARNVHIYPHTGRRARKTHPGHQPIASTVTGSVLAKHVVSPANRMPRVTGRQPTRFSVTR
jgi:hypothetical protein